MRPRQAGQPRRFVGKEHVDQEVANRGVGDETHDRPALHHVRPAAERGHIRSHGEQDHRHAEPPDAAGFPRHDEQLEIVVERFLVPIHRFIYEERAHGIDRPLRVPETIRVKPERGDRGGDDGDHHGHPVFAPRLGQRRAIDGFPVLQRDENPGARPRDETDDEGLLVGEHQADQDSRNPPARHTC